MRLSCTAIGHVLLACSIVLVAACSAHAGSTVDQPATHSTITMHRSTCFGICPSYTVVLQPDGQVRFTGEAHVSTKDASGHANATQIAAIEAALQKAEFATLNSSYVSRDDGCEMVMSDMPGVTITVANASGSKTVDFYYGCDGAIANAVRPRIEQLAKTIDQQLNTAQWIGTPAAPGVRETTDR
ncbi:MAG: DUF6438 domain-containing protein [Rhodanobacter sp.]